jgi:ribonucleoside-diphosphate reductase alpha chain
MKDVGIPNEPCVMKPDSTTVFFFPVAAPVGAVTRDQVSPIEHLNLWKEYNEHWAEHQVSITVSVPEDAWPRVGAWVYDNFDELSGVSFLPMDGGIYLQAPYQECTAEEYAAAIAKMPVGIDWSQLSRYEVDDNTTASHEFACVGGACEVI